MTISPASIAATAIMTTGFDQILVAVSMTFLLFTVAGALLPNTFES